MGWWQDARKVYKWLPALPRARQDITMMVVQETTSSCAYTIFPWNKQGPTSAHNESNQFTSMSTLSYILLNHDIYT